MVCLFAFCYGVHYIPLCHSGCSVSRPSGSVSNDGLNLELSRNFVISGEGQETGQTLVFSESLPPRQPQTQKEQILRKPTFGSNISADMTSLIVFSSLISFIRRTFSLSSCLIFLIMSLIRLKFSLF